MTKQEAERLAREAKHSMAIFIGFVTIDHPKSMGFFLKYPDALDAYVSGNEEQFRKDMAVLIVQPVKAVVDAFVEQTDSQGIGQEVEEAMKMALVSPITTKQQIIRLGNVVIGKMNSKGKVMIPIGAYLEEP